MDEEQAKLKFLKRIIKSHCAEDVVSFVKACLPKKLEGYSGYYLLTSHNINENGRDVSAPAMLQFSKQIYDMWYDKILRVDENKIKNEQIKSIIKAIKYSPYYKKENMDEQKCYNFIFKEYSKLFNDKHLRPMWSQSKLQPIENKRVMSDFIHFTPLFYPKNGLSCRLYLNLSPENAVEVSSLLAKKCKKEKIRLYGKFWTIGAYRNDTFLVYTSFKDVEKMVSILEEIKKENPPLFEGTEKMHVLVGRVNSFIGYADEPEYLHSSFNKERGNAIDEFFKDLMSAEYKRIGNFNGTIKNSRGEELSLKEYLNYRIKTEFINAIESTYSEIQKGIYPDDTSEEFRKSYREMFTKLHQFNKENNLLKSFDDQIQKMSDEIIESLKQGRSPLHDHIYIKTKRTALFPGLNKDFLERNMKRDGFLRYGIRVDVEQKLFDVFGSAQQLEEQITAENLKPYFDKHHVSFQHPYLNTESEDFLKRKDLV